MSDLPIARRQADDGTVVLMWEDGSLTGSLGYKLPGVPMARCKTKAAQEAARAAGWVFLSEMDLYDRDEWGDLYAACRWATARDLPVQAVRTRVADVQARRLVTPVWTVLSANRDGVPTTRYWRPDRMRWPGIAIWDHVSHPRGRYEVVSVDRQGTCGSIGMYFANLDGLRAYLRQHIAPSRCEWLTAEEAAG